MELRQYWAVVRRRWPLVAAIVLLTALLSLGLAVLQHPTYTVTTIVSIRERALPSTPSTPGPTGQPGFYTYDKYYLFYASEFLADDYAIIVTTNSFARLVDAKLAQQAPNAHIEAAGSLSADRKQRELTIAASAGDAGTATSIALAAGAVLTDLSAEGAGSPSVNGISIRDDALFAVIDPPGGAFSNRSRQFTNAAIATGVGLALALALAFLLESLDTSLRDAADAEHVTGLPILGAIPARR